KPAWFASDGSMVHAGDVVVRFDRAGAEKQLREAEAALDLAETNLRLQQLQARSSNAEHESWALREKQEAELAKSQQATDPVLYSRNQIIESELDQGLATARQIQAERTRDVDRSISHTQVELVAIDRDRAKAQVEQARRGLEHLELHAPHD